MRSLSLWDGGTCLLNECSWKEVQTHWCAKETSSFLLSSVPGLHSGIALHIPFGAGAGAAAPARSKWDTQLRRSAHCFGMQEAVRQPPMEGMEFCPSTPSTHEYLREALIFIFIFIFSRLFYLQDNIYPKGLGLRKLEFISQVHNKLPVCWVRSGQHCRLRSPSMMSEEVQQPGGFF